MMAVAIYLTCYAGRTLRLTDMLETTVPGQHAARVPGVPRKTIDVERVSKHFGAPNAGVWALRNVSFTVHAGEFVVLLGESGCGKTTLLRLMAGLDTPTAGRITLAGQEVQGPS